MVVVVVVVAAAAVMVVVVVVVGSGDRRWWFVHWPRIRVKLLLESCRCSRDEQNTAPSPVREERCCRCRDKRLKEEVVVAKESSSRSVAVVDRLSFSVQGRERERVRLLLA
jgi:hypothetical protein